MKLTDDDYIGHILESIAKIEQYLDARSAQDIKTVPMLSEALIRHCVIIGEAAHRITEKTKESTPEIPWLSITGMRNRLIHEYFGVKEDVLWSTCKEDLPQLRTHLQHLHSDFKKQK